MLHNWTVSVIFPHLFPLKDEEPTELRHPRLQLFDAFLRPC